MARHCCKQDIVRRHYRQAATCPRSAQIHFACAGAETFLSAILRHYAPWTDHESTEQRHGHARPGSTRERHVLRLRDIWVSCVVSHSMAPVDMGLQHNRSDRRDSYCAPGFPHSRVVHIPWVLLCRLALHQQLA